MTKSEIELIHRALDLLHRLVPDERPRVGDNVPQPCPVTRFAQKYLAPADADFTCQELWRFYDEVAQAGEFPPMSKAAFLRRLPAVMESVFGLRKCHSIMTEGHRVRGFRGINMRQDDCVRPKTDNSPAKFLRGAVIDSLIGGHPPRFSKTRCLART